MSNGQDKRVNWAEIPDTSQVPAGKILFQITDVDDVFSNSGKLMYVHKLTVVEPQEIAGMVHYERFTIGNDDDPLADQQATWKSSIAARIMKNMYAKARVPFSESMYATIAAAKGAMFIAKTVVKKDNDPNSKYYGQENTNLTTFYVVGETVPALEGSVPGVAGVGVGVSPGMPVMPAAPSALSPMPAAAPGPAPAPPAPVAPPTPAPAAPVKQMTAKAQGTYEQYTGAGWNDAQLIEHGYMEMVNPTPAPALVAAPVMTPAPAPPTMAPPVLAPSLAPSPAPTLGTMPPTTIPASVGEATTMCPLCKTPIPNSQFAMHVPACSAQRAAAAAGGLK